MLVSDTVCYGMHMDENIDTDRRAVDGIHCMFSSLSVFVCVRELTIEFFGIRTMFQNTRLREFHCDCRYRSIGT